MVSHYILGSLAVLSQVLLLWQWVAARRFPLHQRRENEFKIKNEKLKKGNLPGGDTPNRSSTLRGVTLLKPLKGADANTEMCLRSWLTQDYAGPMQTLFGVATADDPAAAVVRKLLAEFPGADAQLVVCPELLGTNAKAAKLIQLERQTKHELICVSDADVCAPGDFLTEAVAALLGELRMTNDELREEGMGSMGNPPLTPPRRRTGERVALVNCFYRLANASTTAMRWEAVAINADFWSQVLQSCSLKPMDFSLGAAMVTRRAELEAIGGFTTIKDVLADDYQLGSRMAKRGGRIEICPVVVECWDMPMGWGAVWKHQVRWARTIRVCQPLPYFFSILSNPTVWPALWAGAVPNVPSLIFLSLALAARMLVTADLQRRLSGKAPVRRSDSATEGGESGTQKAETGCPSPDVGRYRSGYWLAPVKDLLQVVVWAAAFLGNTIDWRGRRMKVRRDGTLVAEGNKLNE